MTETTTVIVKVPVTPDRDLVENEVERIVPRTTAAASSAAAAAVGDNLRVGVPVAAKTCAIVLPVGAREHQCRVDGPATVHGHFQELGIARPCHDWWNEPSTNPDYDRRLDGDLDTDLPA